VFPASVIDAWGSTAAERAARYPCDDLVEAPRRELFRAVGVEAPAEIVFRWVCQLRAAPYSYDLIDNLGRRSPRELTPGLDDLAPGQQVMTIFRLVSFEAGRSITVDARTRLFGYVAVTYRVVPDGDDRCRLVAKIVVARRSGRAARLLDRALPLGDLVMMRKQLLTLKARSEHSAR
jgi:hypothetical protein